MPLTLRERATRVLSKIDLIARPRVVITDPPPGVTFERDVAIPLRDGVLLRANVFRPAAEGHYPVLLSLHPYGKDGLPRLKAPGRYAIPLQYRLLGRQQPIQHSAWTGWEAPDPGHWVPRGYVVINADLRGWGTSDGVGELFSAQEGEDGHDVVEWAAAQPWSNGKVGMTGVSYLAITQWATAATRPPHLAAISPWEGFTDPYRDFAYPGGVREDGFSIVWDRMMRVQHRSPVDLRRQITTRPQLDAWWTQRQRDIEQIDVPALVCGSFSDHSLHSGGSFEGFRRIGSSRKWLYTHRGPKWSTYYSAEALATQHRFFDHFLRGDDTGILDEPPVRVEIRSDRDTITAVRAEQEWPSASVLPTPLFLDANGGRLQPEATPVPSGSVHLQGARDRAAFRVTFKEPASLVGPMRLHLWIQSHGPQDLDVFVGVRKYRDGKEVPFEGSYGFANDLVTRGMLRAAHRRVDPALSTLWEPHHPHDVDEPLPLDLPVELQIALLPSATSFLPGDELELDVRGSWFFPGLPIVGSFPARYRSRTHGAWSILTGPEHPSRLIVPVYPTA